MDLSISIRRAILHILDTNAGIPVLSDTPLSLQLAIGDYISTHIEKAFKDADVRRARWMEPPTAFAKAYQTYKENPESFIEFSQNAARLLYDFMLENVEIPSADLLVMECMIDGEPWLALLKMNYKHSYIHFVNHEETCLNDIMRQPCALPTESQRLDEFVLIELNTDILHLKEKKYPVDGQKRYYLSEDILGCTESLSEKQSYDIVEKTVKKIVASEYGGDIEKLSTARSVMANDYEAASVIDLDSIADATFGNDLTIKERFREEVEKKGLVESKVPVTANLEKKIFKKQKFITDNGIELAIPTELLTRKDLVEFKNNPDGTVSVEIKKIEGFNAR